MIKDTTVVISDGSLKQYRIGIKETMLELYGRALKCVSLIMFRDIPTYLLHMLENYISMVRRWRKSPLSFLNREAGECRVYDLGNCGPMNQFMVGNLIAHNCQYGAGVRKVTDTLEANGIYMDEEEVYKIWKGYWNLFDGLVKLREMLEEDCHYTRGYVLNGFGRPMCVTPDYEKDLLNRFIQSTGHDVLVRYIAIYTAELDRRQIPWKPIVLDWHDSSCVEVPKEHEQETTEVFLWALGRLNTQLGWTIQLKGTPTIGVTLADVKEPEN